MAPYYFFLSYSREDRVHDPDGTIESFHKELAEAVRMRTGWEASRVGFLETQGIQPGTLWPDNLSAELATCRAFVPVLSPTYFTRDFCGKEWAVFARRLREGRGPNELIMPVQLSAPRYLTGIPAAIDAIQRTHDDYPSAYNDEGLSQIARLPDRRGAYLELVERFADKLVAAVSGFELAPAPAVQDLRTVASAFHDPSGRVATRSPGQLSGPRFVQFVFVAARRDELEGVRNDLRFYGEEGGADWQPYLPDLDDEAAIIAQEVATAEKLRYEPLPLDDGFIASIEEAAALNKIVVVLVDSWTVRLERYRNLMERLDNRDFHNCIVVIPWNRSDGETTGSRSLLLQAIQATFVSKARRREAQTFVDTPESALELKAELARSLAATRARILERRDVRRRAESEGIFVVPNLVATAP